MHSIGDIMKEMQIAPPTTSQPINVQPALASRLQSRLLEYSCSQLSEEDYRETTSAWDEWPYSWVCQLNDFARHRFHSFHQNHATMDEARLTESICEQSEYSEYSQVTAKAA